MPIYAYLCRGCGASRDSTRRDDVARCSCGDVSRRDYRTVQLRPASPFQPHWNPATGSYVHTKREFNERLKVLAADNTEQTGTEHKYEMIDPGDLVRQQEKLRDETVERSIAIHHNKNVAAL